MTMKPEEFIATLVFPDDYIHHLNQVVGLTSQKITFLKRKFASQSGWELVNYPTEDCIGIIYKDERPILKIISGIVLILLIIFIFSMLFAYGEELGPGTSVPIGALGLAAFAGLRWAFGSRRHKIIFVLRDGVKLTWMSRAGDYKYKMVSTSKVVDFAISAGLMQSAP